LAGQPLLLFLWSAHHLAIIAQEGSDGKIGDERRNYAIMFLKVTEYDIDIFEIIMLVY